MLSRSLEKVLNEAFRDARSKAHESLTVEHLLLALLGLEEACDLLRSGGADPEGVKSDLQQYLEQNVRQLPEHDPAAVQPTPDFQRVLQRAVFRAQSAGRKEVSASGVLMSVTEEAGSHGAMVLRWRGFDRGPAPPEPGEAERARSSDDSSNQPEIRRLMTMAPGGQVSFDRLERRLDEVTAEVRELRAEVGRLLDRLEKGS